MKCLNKAFSCLWPKSANGNVEIPFLLSRKYGGFDLLRYRITGSGYRILTCLFHTLTGPFHWWSTFSTISDASEKHTIVKALKDFETKTCIRFVHRAAQRAYLSIEPRYGWVENAVSHVKGKNWRENNIIPTLTANLPYFTLTYPSKSQGNQVSVRGCPPLKNNFLNPKSLSCCNADGHLMLHAGMGGLLDRHRPRSQASRGPLGLSLCLKWQVMLKSHRSQFISSSSLNIYLALMMCPPLLHSILKLQ